MDNLTRSLLNYFGMLGALRDHEITLRDINLQVMMNVYAAEERAQLGVALAALVDDGTLQMISATSYRLTSVGIRRVRDLPTHQGRKRRLTYAARASQPAQVPNGV